MALEISYWSGPMGGTQVAQFPIGAETRSLSGTSAVSGATPVGAVLVKITATEACRFAYGAGTPVASAATPYLAAGEIQYLAAQVGHKVAGITA